jgi:hypothetical protein
MRIRPMGAELPHADGQTDRPDELKISQFLRTRLKTNRLTLYCELLVICSDIRLM